jgi:hypothetical protein
MSEEYKELKKKLLRTNKVDRVIKRGNYITVYPDRSTNFTLLNVIEELLDVELDDKNNIIFDNGLSLKMTSCEHFNTTVYVVRYRIIEELNNKYISCLREFKKLTKDTRYENNEELYIALRHYGEDGRRFIDMVIENDLNVSISPYSWSLYAFKGDEEITWGYKPENSLRLSNHWNFDGHCITDCGSTQKIMLCKYHNGIYSQI